MKKILFFILAVTAVGFVACGGDGIDDVLLEAALNGGSDGTGGTGGTGGSGGSGGSSTTNTTCICTMDGSTISNTYSLSQYPNASDCSEIATKYLDNTSATWTCVKK